MTYRTPTCYGDPSKWSPAAVECVGGLDPGYMNPTTLSHKREQCMWYAQCAAACAKKKLESRAVPMVSPIQPVQVQVAPPPIPAASHPLIQQYGRGPITTYNPHYPYPQPYAQPQYPMPAMAPQQMLPPWLAQWGPQLVPVMFQQPGAQMSSYLTVPEPVNPNERWIWRLLREILRSMFKSSGHTAANFFDHNPWHQYEAPPVPPPQLPASTQTTPQQ